MSRAGEPGPELGATARALGLRVGVFGLDVRPARHWLCVQRKVEGRRHHGPPSESVAAIAGAVAAAHHVTLAPLADRAPAGVTAGLLGLDLLGAAALTGALLRAGVPPRQAIGGGIAFAGWLLLCQGPAVRAAEALWHAVRVAWWRRRERRLRLRLDQRVEIERQRREQSEIDLSIDLAAFGLGYAEGAEAAGRADAVPAAPSLPAQRGAVLDVVR